MDFIKLFVPSFVFYFLIDILWVTRIAKRFYAESIGHLLRTTDAVLASQWSAAIIVYVLMIVGILAFVLPKTGGSYLMGLLWGAFFGLIVYGAYDFTNYAILAGWPLNLTIIDIIWGMVMCGLTSLLATIIQSYLYA